MLDPDVVPIEVVEALRARVVSLTEALRFYATLDGITGDRARAALADVGEGTPEPRDHGIDLSHPAPCPLNDAINPKGRCTCRAGHTDPAAATAPPTCQHRPYPDVRCTLAEGHGGIHVTEQIAHTDPTGTTP